MSRDAGHADDRAAGDTFNGQIFQARDRLAQILIRFAGEGAALWDQGIGNHQLYLRPEFFDRQPLGLKS